MIRDRGRSFGTLAGAGALALCAVLTGCGGGSETEGVATLTGNSGSAEPTEASAENTGDAEEKALRFARCMRDNGIKDFPDPEVDSEGNVTYGFGARAGGGSGDRPDFDRETMDKAFKACEKYATMPGPQRLTAAQSAELEDAMLAYATCMRENGYDMPDPDFSGGGPGSRAVQIEPGDPTYKKADEACKDKLQPLQEMRPGRASGS
jgi:hypothetical protein